MTDSDPNRIIKRYASIPGSKLVGWRAVGMAIYKVDVTITLLAKSKLVPIEEYLLRSIQIGIDDCLNLSRLLGLDLMTVEKHMIVLNKAELIASSIAADEVERFRLTRSGQSTVETAEQVSVRDETIPVLVHGFTRKPIPYQQLLDSRECAADELVQIGALGGRPTLEDLTATDIKAVFEDFWKRRKNADEIPHIVGVRQIAKKGPVLYQPAILLCYETEGESGTRHYSFAVQGEKREDYAEAFDQDRLLPKTLALHPLKTVAESAEEHLPSDFKYAISELEETDGLLEKVDVLKFATQTCKEDLEISDSEDERNTKSEELAKLDCELQEVQRKLTNAAVIPLRTRDCDSLLSEAIRNASERLVIVSGTVSNRAVRSIMRDVEEAIQKRNVRIWVGFGMGGGDRQSRAQRDRPSYSEAIQLLDGLVRRFPDNITVKDLGDVHSKILLCDSTFVAVGSYNWLSYKPNSTGAFRQEHAFRVADADQINWFLDECEGLFGEPVGRKVNVASKQASVRQSKETDSTKCAPLSAGAVFDKYRLIKPITGGGMSEAFVAERAAADGDGTKLFLKRVQVNSAHEASLGREIRIYEKLVRLKSQRVAEFVDFIRTDDFVSFVTELADGDLQEFVRDADTGVSEELVKGISLQVAEALQELHDNDIIHRDLKPENILRFNDVWKLADFGLSKNLSRGITQRTMRQKGTSGYAPPEQWAGADAHPSADIYSLGKVIVFLLTKQTDVDRLLDRSWSPLVRRCVSENPADRPCIEAVISELRDI